MKLYTTVTSERASKGQGGNEYISIRVTDEKKQVIAELDIQNGHARFWKDSTALRDWNEAKGEKQKGERERDLREIAKLEKQLDSDPEWRAQ